MKRFKQKSVYRTDDEGIQTFRDRLCVVAEFCSNMGRVISVVEYAVDGQLCGVVYYEEEV